MGTINIFYNQVNQEIQNCPALKKFYPLPKTDYKVENFPSLFSITSQVLNNAQVDISRTDINMQERYLGEQKNFSDWTKALTICLPSASEQHTQHLLKKTLAIEPKNPEHVLLEHFFREMYENSSRQVQKQIIANKRVIQPLKQSFSLKIQESIEKIADVISRIFSNPEFRKLVVFTAQLTSYIATSIALMALTNALSPIILPYTPVFVIRTGTFVYDNILKIGFSIIFADAYTKIKAPKINQWIFKPLWNSFSYTFLIGSHIRLGLSSKVANLFRNNLPFVATSMQALSSKWNDLRLGHEYKEARDLWINIFLNERQKSRAEIEYDYAVDELNYLQENNLPTVEAQNTYELAKQQLEASTKLMLAS